MPQKRKPMSSTFRRKIFDKYNGICQICGIETRFFNCLYDSPFYDGPVAGTVDHILPFSMGGTDDESNLRWACRSCNCARGNRV